VDPAAGIPLEPTDRGTRGDGEGQEQGEHVLSRQSKPIAIGEPA
jgi:hypothetical protein